jgi:hypothetical protein
MIQILHWHFIDLTQHSFLLLLGLTVKSSFNYCRRRSWQ